MVYLVKRQNNKGAAASRLNNECQKLRVDGRETAIVSAPREPNAFVALLLLSDAAVDVPELGDEHLHQCINSPRYHITHADQGLIT